QEGSYILNFDPLEAFSGLRVSTNDQALDSIAVYFKGYENYPFPAGRVILSSAGKRRTYSLWRGRTKLPKAEIEASKFFAIEFIDRTHLSFSPSAVLTFDRLTFDPSLLENACATRIINDQVKILKKQGRKRLMGQSTGMGQEAVFVRLP
ncbi:MAG: hypothetical protein AAFN10_12030, partial [Bacteroidota bacterium]